MAVRKNRELDLEKEVSVTLTSKDRAYLMRAVVTLRQALIRSRAKEVAGSQVWEFRGAELDELDELVRKLGSS